MGIGLLFKLRSWMGGRSGILQKPQANMVNGPQAIEPARAEPKPEEGRGLTGTRSEQTSGWIRQSRFRDGG